MKQYCKTLAADEDGRHRYGVDLVEYRNGTYHVPLHISAATESFEQLCRLVKWMNETNLPPEYLEGLMAALWERGN